MRFVDEARIHILSGSGGNGAASFRREKFVPHGGPDGGDGGRGGDVIFVAETGRSSLLELRGHAIWRAPSGQHGSGSQMHGAGGDDLRIKVPVGTQVFDEASEELLADLKEPGQEAVIAVGGRGGKGNVHFKSSTNRTPLKATKGAPGEELRLRLELKLMADVGLLGFPNAGKSTFISQVSAARPKVADYPFTTLAPSLGVVRVDTERSFVVADIPGLIRGASDGAGLGHQFLRHLTRTRVLLHLVSLGPDETETPEARYEALRQELLAYDEDLAGRPEIIVLNKGDVADPEELRELAMSFVERVGRDRVAVISAATGQGVDALVQRVWEEVSAVTE